MFEDNSRNLENRSVCGYLTKLIIQTANITLSSAKNQLSQKWKSNIMPVSIN